MDDGFIPCVVTAGLALCVLRVPPALPTARFAANGNGQ